MVHVPSAHRIDAIVPQILKRAEQHHRTLATIQRAWRSLVGKGLAGHTRPASLRGGQLIVYADRPGDGFALSYLREPLLRRLGELSRERVRELIIRPEDPARRTHQQRCRI